MRSWGLHRVTSLLLVVVLPIAVVAAFVKDDDTDTREEARSFVEVADRTTAVDHLRYESTMELHAGPVDIDPVVIGHGEQAGTSFHFITDPGAFTEAIGGGDLGDQTMETFSDGTTTYLRAPGFAALAQNGPLPPRFQPLVDLGDRWGVIDQSRIAVLDVTSQFNSSGLSVASALDLLRQVAEGVEPAGTGDVHGVAVDLYEGTITFGDMISSAGMDPQMFESLMEGIVGGSGPDTSEILEAMNAAEMSIEVGVDDDGRVRRMSYGFDQRFFNSIAEGLGVEPEDLGFSMTSAIELFDLGDESITVELPTVEDPVDLTPWALELYGAQTD